jgi:hypothetical protein
MRVGRGNGDLAVDLLADVLGAEVVAIGPSHSPLPVTGRCTRCGSPTTVYGPKGSPLRDQCRDRGSSRPVKTAESA